MFQRQLPPTLSDLSISLYLRWYGGWWPPRFLVQRLPTSEIAPPPLYWMGSSWVRDACCRSYSTIFCDCKNLKEEKDIQHIKDPTDNTRFLFLLGDYFGWMCGCFLDDLASSFNKKKNPWCDTVPLQHLQRRHFFLSFFLFSHCQQEKIDIDLSFVFFSLLLLL